MTLVKVVSLLRTLLVSGGSESVPHDRKLAEGLALRMMNSEAH